jgi:hypothetical protein
MTRKDLEHILRAAKNILNKNEFTIIGSQSILGKYPEYSTKIMDRQQLSNLRSIETHRVISEKLESNPNLWNRPVQNLERWEKIRGKLLPAHQEWKIILESKTKDEILELMRSPEENSIRLRSSSPFVGILSPQEKDEIFLSYSKMYSSVNSY